MTDEVLKIWYVSPQRLCNFRCPYCVSTGAYAKSDTHDWKSVQELENFRSVVHWLGTRPFSVGVRLATLGEPFASNEFLDQAVWLTRQKNIKFVELLTNGSLLQRRLPQIESRTDFHKLSLWITHHHSQIAVDRFIENARIAQEQYGCFVVVNGLLFPDNAAQVIELRAAVLEAGLRFNLDLGYDLGAPAQVHEKAASMVPILRSKGGLETALRLGANPVLMDTNIIALNDPHNRACSAGHRYFYIGIEGDVYQCSRYYVLKKNKLGNVLEPGFDLPLRQNRWIACQARFGCCNKEDFLNLQDAAGRRDEQTPSLGWLET